jgi:hypothetical protein
LLEANQFALAEEISAMGFRDGLFAAAAIVALVGPAHAQTVKPKPLQGGSISLGDVAGNAYYTVEPKGFRVVITLTKDTNRPVRFETVLSQGQSITLSAPRELGSTSEVIEITREGDSIVVTKPQT